MTPTTPPPEIAAEVARQLAAIRRGTVNLVSEAELSAKIERSLIHKKPLRVKLGVDPTSPLLHLGFTVPLTKLRLFQDLGHHPVLIIGDATALVGDPTGRNKTRPRLTPEEVDGYSKTYLTQAGKVLDMSRVEVRFNREWLGKLDFLGLIGLTARSTVARLMEREDFKSRWTEGTAIHLHELIYPLLQGYDSVMVRADVELGGSDQLFNLLVGRDLQEQDDQPPQACITGPLLIGLDGQKKMSKSAGNTIGITEPPEDMALKVMRVPDAQLRSWFELLTKLTLPEIDAMLAPDRNPKDAKLALLRYIVDQYHGAGAGERAVQHWTKTVAKKEVGEDAPKLRVAARGPSAEGIWTMVELLVATGLCASKSEARRHLEAGAVSLDGNKVTSPIEPVPIATGNLLRVGRQKYGRLEIE